MSTLTARTLDQLHADLRNGALATDTETRRRHAQAAWDGSLGVLASEDSTPSQCQSALSCFTEARALFEAADDLPQQGSAAGGVEQP